LSMSSTLALSIRMGYKWDICLGLIRACLRIIRKYKKTGNPHKQRISGIS
jgi:hypothetical protein